MTNINSVSQSDLNQRRQKLRTHRQLQLLQSCFRTLAISGILGGLVWAITRPNWVIRGSNQVVIEENKWLSQQQIQSLLPLKYPQSLLQIEPEAIARTLESSAPIADVTVNRRLFPPSLVIQVQERVPVAIAITKTSSSSSSQATNTPINFIDQNGVLIPITSYAPPVSHQFLTTLKLKVIGQSKQYCPYWHQIYQTVSRSPVNIQEINCQDLNNLIFKTDLGLVHLGPYTRQLAEQLTVLDQMRQITTRMNSSQIAYIDLKNLETPLVQTHHTQKMLKPQ